MNAPAHTPTPYNLSGRYTSRGWLYRDITAADGTLIAKVLLGRENCLTRPEENAAFIVRAANNFEAVLARLQGVALAQHAAGMYAGSNSDHQHDLERCSNAGCQGNREILRAAGAVLP